MDRYEENSTKIVWVFIDRVPRSGRLRIENADGKTRIRSKSHIKKYYTKLVDL